MTALPDTHASARSTQPCDRHLIECAGAQVEVHARRAATVLSIGGDIDVSNVDLVVQAIRRYSGLKALLIVDLSDLDFLGVAGLQALLTLNEEHRQAQLLCGVVTGRALRTLTRVFPDHGLHVVASVPQALEQIDAAIRDRRRSPSGVAHQQEPQRKISG
jgi:anti-anti-sigma factor